MMDPQHAQSFQTAVKEVLSTMLGLQAEVNGPLDHEDELQTEVAAVIGLSGDVTGSVTITFPELTALRLVQRFAGVEMRITDEDFADAIGELLNMIAGSAKSRLAGAKSALSLPQVMVGSQLHLLGATRQEAVAFRCETDCGPFHLALGLRQAKRNTAAA